MFSLRATEATKNMFEPYTPSNERQGICASRLPSPCLFGCRGKLQRLAAENCTICKQGCRWPSPPGTMEQKIPGDAPAVFGPLHGEKICEASDVVPRGINLHARMPSLGGGVRFEHAVFWLLLLPIFSIGEGVLAVNARQAPQNNSMESC